MPNLLDRPLLAALAVLTLLAVAPSTARAEDPHLDVVYNCSRQNGGTNLLSITPVGFPAGQLVNFYLFPENFYLGGGGQMAIGGFIGEPFSPSPFTLPAGPHFITANVRDPGAPIQSSFVVEPCPVIHAEIDIKPGGHKEKVEKIDADGHGKHKVAILSSPDFDAPTEVDITSLRLGRSAQEQSLIGCERKGHDANHDHLRDLICEFSDAALGFTPGEGLQTIRLYGTTFDGTAIEAEGMVFVKK